MPLTVFRLSTFVGGQAAAVNLEGAGVKDAAGQGRSPSRDRCEAHLGHALVDDALRPPPGRVAQHFTRFGQAERDAVAVQKRTQASDNRRAGCCVPRTLSAPRGRARQRGPQPAPAPWFAPSRDDPSAARRQTPGPERPSGLNDDARQRCRLDGVQHLSPKNGAALQQPVENRVEIPAFRDASAPGGTVSPRSMTFHWGNIGSGRHMRGLIGVGTRSLNPRAYINSICLGSPRAVWLTPSDPAGRASLAAVPSCRHGPPGARNAMVPRYRPNGAAR